MDPWLAELQLELWQKFALSALIGLLVGLEREHSHLEKEGIHFAGIRTFPLITLLGSTTALLSTINSISLFAIGLAGLFIIVVVVYAFSAYRGDSGLTTEITVLLAYLIGGLVYWDQIWLAIALGVLITIFLALRSVLVKLVRRIEREDIYATLQFAVVSAVILPLLPNATYGPLDVINPFQIWLMVVFVSTVSFSGYIANKILGIERSVWLSGLLGGIVSSTAATLSFSQRSKEETSLSRHLAMGIMLSCTVMYLRVLIEIVAFNPEFAAEAWWPLLILAGLGFAGGCYLWWAARSKTIEASKFDNPFRLKPAFQIGLIFGLVLFVTKAATVTLGETGILAASSIAGLAKIDPIALSLAQLAGRDVSYQIATQSLLLAVTANLLGKIGLVSIMSSRKLRNYTLPLMGLMALASLGLAAWV